MNEDKVYCACLRVSYKVKEVFGAIWRENWECDSCGREFKKKEIEMDRRQDFGWALDCLRDELKVRRSGWNGKGMWLASQVPGENSKMTHPYLVMHIPECEEGLRLLPWQPAQVDLFAEDWEIVE